MIKRIGTSDGTAIEPGTGAPLVLLDLTAPEREALARVLRLAEDHLDEIPFPLRLSRRAIAEQVIAALRSELSLPEIRRQEPPAPAPAR